MHVWKCGAQSAKDILQTRQPRPLAGQGNLLHHIGPKKTPGLFNVSFVKNFVNESANDGVVILHLRGQESGMFARLFKSHLRDFSFTSFAPCPA
jgi:hypothetical protein